MGRLFGGENERALPRIIAWHPCSAAGGVDLNPTPLLRFWIVIAIFRQSGGSPHMVPGEEGVFEGVAFPIGCEGVRV